MRIMAALFLMFSLASPAAAGQTATSDEAAIRAVIATWYGELQKVADRKHWQLSAPMAIDGGPAETEINPRSRARSPTISNELAARALQFAYEIDVLTVDPRLAKAVVWERGYFYASANQETYENAAIAVFVMEKQPDGRWLILAHQASSTGIPATKRTVPLPDMKPRWEAIRGPAAKTPAAD
ncbi:MAG: hypothetical protein WC829_23555 [Hyphomicrobium sp.]